MSSELRSLPEEVDRLPIREPQPLKELIDRNISELHNKAIKAAWRFVEQQAEHYRVIAQIHRAQRRMLEDLLDLCDPQLDQSESA